MTAIRTVDGLKTEALAAMDRAAKRAYEVVWPLADGVDGAFKAELDNQYQASPRVPTSPVTLAEDMKALAKSIFGEQYRDGLDAVFLEWRATCDRFADARAWLERKPADRTDYLGLCGVVAESPETTVIIKGDMPGTSFGGDEGSLSLVKEIRMLDGVPKKYLVVKQSGSIDPKRTKVATAIEDWFTFRVKNHLHGFAPEAVVSGIVSYVEDTFFDNRGELPESRDSLKKDLSNVPKAVNTAPISARIEAEVELLFQRLSEMDEAFAWKSSGNVSMNSTAAGMDPKSLLEFLKNNDADDVVVLVDPDLGSALKKDVEFIDGKVYGVIVVGSNVRAGA